MFRTMGTRHARMDPGTWKAGGALYIRAALMPTTPLGTMARRHPSNVTKQLANSTLDGEGEPSTNADPRPRAARTRSLHPRGPAADGVQRHNPLPMVFP